MAKRYIVTVMLVFILAIGTIAIIKGGKTTGAYLTDTEQSSNNSFGQIKFTDVLELTSGRSRAHYVTKPGPFPLVATLENSNLKLDFGEIIAGNSANFSDVFQIKNLSAQSVTIDLKISDELNSILASVQVEKEPVIESGETKSVIFKLKTIPQTVKKIYSGQLTVSIAKTLIKKDIPVKVIVI